MDHRLIFVHCDRVFKGDVDLFLQRKKKEESIGLRSDRALGFWQRGKRIMLL